MKTLSYLLFTSILLAQPSSHLVYVNSAPGGACNNAAALQRVVSSGDIWNCISGTWTKAISGGAGSVAFSGITAGTNTTAAMVVGVGASLTVPTQSTGDSSGLAASDLYVSTLIAYFTPYGSVQAGTAAVLSNTPTYNNGTGGVGATLTAGSNGALIVDGYTVLLNDRVLVKNQAAALQNGVYTLTTLGTGGVPYVLTRATDYNTLSDINFTGDILFLNGSTQSGQSWYLNAKITAVGTSALNYTQDSTVVNSNNGNVKATGSLAAGDVITGNGGKTVQDSGTLLSSLAPKASPVFTGTPTAPTPASTDNSTKLATTAYVYSIVKSSIAVQAATTQASDTSSLTYNNGVAGIGATLTGAVNTALTIDGFTFNTLNQRLLVKNDTQSPSGAFNGIYYVTQLQGVALPPVLTRALDYDSSSDINNTGAVSVISGTANTKTSWLLTSTVATVGTDPLTYAQFSYAPVTTTCTAPQLISAVTNGTGTCTTPTIPPNNQSTAYTTVLGDAGKMLIHPSSDNNARTFTIDSNANVAFPTGTCITFVNMINTLTIAITSDTMTLMSSSSSTGSRTLAANNWATACKIASTAWVIGGSSGVT